MEFLKILTYFTVVTGLVKAAEKESSRNATKQRFSFKSIQVGEGFSPFVSTSSEKSVSFKNADNLNHSTKKSFSNNKPTFSIKRYDSDDLDGFSYKSAINLDDYWVKTPYHNFTSRRDGIKKHDYSSSWPTWSSKKEIFHNNRKKNRKYIDSIEDYLGLDSKYHELADRKYIHEHEGFFFPIHVPSSHHEKDDHLIPLLLLLLLPLLLFAIIIPLNANLLSTLFLIMQNNGATTTAAQLAAATGRRKRHLNEVSHPIVEEKIMEILHRISSIPDF